MNRLVDVWANLPDHRVAWEIENATEIAVSREGSPTARVERHARFKCDTRSEKSRIGPDRDHRLGRAGCWLG